VEQDADDSFVGLLVVSKFTVLAARGTKAGDWYLHPSPHISGDIPQVGVIQREAGEDG
jgi:hypothetical protein